MKWLFCFFLIEEHLTSTNILLAKASHTAMGNFKGMETCNVCPEGEENQKYW